MKKILTLILIALSTQVYAQLDGDYNFSIGIRAFNVSQRPKLLQQVNTDAYIGSALNGAMIKFNDNQMAFRISGHYQYDRNKQFPNLCNNCETATGTLSDYGIKLGFEKNFNYSVLQPYFGTDFGYRSSNFNGQVKPNDPLSLNLPYTATTNKNSAVFSPLIGVKFNLANQFSFYTEASIDMLYSYERQETVTNNNSSTRTFARYNKFEVLMNLFSVGLQFHFSNNN